MPPTTRLLVSAVASPLAAILSFFADMPPIVTSGLLWLAALFAAGVGLYGLVWRGDRRTTLISALLIVYALPLVLFGFVGCAFGSCSPWID